MTDPTPAATARDALKALHDFLWDEMEWFSDESAPMPRYTTMAHGQKHDDLVERFHDAYPELLAAAEAPGRVAALETALRSIAAKEPAPAIPGCTCDPDSATDDDGNLVMCDLHEPMLRHLRWETLASLVIDYQAFMRHALAVADAALSAPAPTPSEPVGRCGTCDEPKDHWRHGFATWSDHPDGHPFTSGARDE